ncbi:MULTISPECIES: DNA cytosine methyltransferase [Xanthomonas]|uniref:DNA (cytosine-5-)-methyltransferase n=2 Tax=Xanthomonas citri TaxID=346 RepID=A0AB33CMG3_XANCI|nr:MULTISPECIES: DNA cytosine methyltransferase [Xanthomonas]MBV6780916.1 DNA cytosine methyltransferase [Xanthomonas campestris pv. trichodesmae]ASK91837.1 DNA methyltransferase [Xanthomonas citri pv. vignicola]MBV6788440.1 DNA cytosine methyltransferase [Xanthomonas campestris pv. clerodendri]MBZ3919243.1 DNA methyltransferase [Xanthomonas campestris pv. trichodesmae]MBZ3922876.1 DNA methyltransferase [Xanthomonas citri pv. sesbaniae]
MADGSHSFNFPAPQVSCLRPGEIVVDLFAGGGGASEALKQALGVDPALAYNHNEWAIGMHAANHPLTIHHREDIWHADPRRDVAGRPIGWFHASPDCTHFSQAKGGQPRSHKTRALSWVALKWIGQLLRADLRDGTNTAPRILSLENVWQILTWGPLVAKRCRLTGRVLKMDGTVAARGERVPVANQQLVPDKRHSGRTWRQFVAALESKGYRVEWRKLTASDYGAGTSRERLFLLARRDGEPIVWPAPTHGTAPGQQPRVRAADCLDFSLPCPSIFTRKRPLADATLRRIAKGVMRHVLQSADPFIVPATHQGSDRVNDVQAPLPTITAANRGELMLVAPELAPFITEHSNASNQRTMRADEPLRTICAGVKGGHFSAVAPILAGVGGRAGQSEPRSGAEPLYTMTTKADTALVAPIMVQAGHGDGRPGAAQRWGSGSKDARTPVGTVTASGSGGQAVACAFLEQANGGFYEGGGRDARDPMSTITASGSQQQLATAHLITMRRNAHGQDAGEPLGTVCAGAVHHGVVECTLSAEQQAGALQVAAFLVKYYGTGIGVDLREPLDTVTTKDRLALVTVVIKGTPYVIVDIGLRMLKPHELFRAQGFPATYRITHTADGRAISTSAAVRMCGNSVSPPPLVAIATVNLDTKPLPLQVAA